jgi:hypothetical protein
MSALLVCAFPTFEQQLSNNSWTSFFRLRFMPLQGTSPYSNRYWMDIDLWPDHRQGTDGYKNLSSNFQMVVSFTASFALQTNLLVEHLTLLFLNMFHHESQRDWIAES